MQHKFKLLSLCAGSLFLFFLNSSISLTSSNTKPLQYNLDEELRKGNFLIGIKQYVGKTNKKKNDEKGITFSTEKKLLKLRSSNGVILKSKKIKIIFQELLLNEPYFSERYVSGPYSSYESAKKESIRLKKIGIEPLIAFPKDWELWLPLTTSLPKNSNFKLIKQSISHQIVPFLQTEFSSHKLEGPIFVSSDEIIKIDNKKYGKDFYLVNDSYGTWTLVQQLSFGKYLEGVLPHEIGINSPIEALKSQAIIARTWALYNSDRFKIDNYHLCVTTECQVYKPSPINSQRVKKAINSTANQILIYRDKPINAFYHASNGGISASASESWDMQDYPYLQSRPDSIIKWDKVLTLPFIDENYLQEFLDNPSKNIFGQKHYLFRWKKKISVQDIKNILLKNKLITKDMNSFEILIKERGLSGRVTELSINYKNMNKKVILKKDQIRKVLKFLPSNLFIIDKLNDNFWLFHGAGFGHGVGLSQSGAIEMANAGFNFKTILNNYYPGTKLKTIEYIFKKSNFIID